MAIVASLLKDGQRLGIKELCAILRVGGSSEQQSCEEAVHSERTEWRETSWLTDCYSSTRTQR